MTYADRLAAFVALSSYFVEVWIRRPLTHPEVTESWLLNMGASESRPANGHACDCCGTLKLKHIYPVALAGDMGRLKWIGAECRRNLKDMRLLKRGGMEHYIPGEV